ncbi:MULTISPECIES: hypothetical protein [unclassified Mycoplasma]|uniref:hypothetical protein n=1 Tax=unclassified Mycoplasma TaxID=2683645 RepID=UPI00216B659A|nr:MULTISPECIES: hypothetical protein [unclassified Mycoplasma]MCS4536685.1 hypothetical protein [Mycoplasma sp. CSL7475-4]MCT4469828.1 hypothetical protein [Mycoplasma sp. HS2188]
MKSPKKINLENVFPSKGYDAKSLFSSLLKEDENFKNDVEMFFSLLPENNLDKDLDDVFISQKELNSNQNIDIINTKELTDIKVNLTVFEQKLKGSKNNYFNKISLQDKETLEMTKQFFLEMRNFDGYDTGLNSRFDDGDTMTIAESAEIVITKVEL